MDLIKLKEELNTNSYPTDCQEAAEIINTKSITSYQEIVSGLVRGYLASIEKLFDIDQASRNPDHPLKDVALALMMTLQPGGGVDFSIPLNVYMLDVLAQGFGITTEQKLTLLSMGEIKISRAEELGLGKVRAGDVERARAL